MSDELKPIAMVDVLIFADKNMSMTTKVDCRIVGCPEGKEQEATNEIMCLALQTLAAYLDKHANMSEIAMKQLIDNAFTKNREGA